MVGSSPDARRAGSPDAIMAMIRKSAAIDAKVIGSVALTPTSMLVIARVRPKEAATPIATPVAISSTMRCALPRGNRRTRRRDVRRA